MLDHHSRFYSEILAKQWLNPKYLGELNQRLSLTRITPPDQPTVNGGGIDVLGLAHQLVGVLRQRQIRKLRERIDREIAAIEGAH